MVLEHDFVKMPELTNEEMSDLYFESPHRQILESFTATVQKVIDGDTIKVLWYGRDFPFRVRFAETAAKELSEGGEDSQSWLEDKILGEEVFISINPFNRVGKWGRLIGKIYHNGIDIGQESLIQGMSVTWQDRNDGLIKHDLEKGWSGINDAAI